MEEREGGGGKGRQESGSWVTVIWQLFGSAGLVPELNLYVSET